MNKFAFFGLALLSCLGCPALAASAEVEPRRNNSNKFTTMLLINVPVSAECFWHDTLFYYKPLRNTTADGAVQCQKLCKDAAGCDIFSYIQEGGICLLFPLHSYRYQIQV